MSIPNNHVCDFTQPIDHQSDFTANRAGELAKASAQLGMNELISRDSSLVQSLELIDLIFFQASGVSMDNWDGASNGNDGQFDCILLAKL